MNQVRVRFAPSPTGHLHVGGARTALFNYLFVRQLQGVFVLRIEDTDIERSTEESVTGILESMKFLGLEWDEGPEKGGDSGPYFQSQRLDLYRKYADILVKSNRAYQCFCTPQELDEMRQAQKQRKEDLKYDGRCRHLTEEQKMEYIEQGRKSVLRFKADNEGITIVDDLIKGKVTFDNNHLDDFVILKSDGMPTYNYAVVIDDALMQISHVIRGEDHLSNTPKQIQIYEALGVNVPQFAHMPMILGPDKSLLSKRHGATSVTQYRDEGYLPSAMVNYLALLGWSYDDSQTIFSKQELIDKFSLEKVSKNPAVFDLKKLQWMNGVHIREMTIDELYQMVLPRWQDLDFLPENPSREQENKGKSVLKALHERTKLLNELDDSAYYFFQDELHYNDKAVNKVLYKEDVYEILEYLLTQLIAVKAYTQENLEPIFKNAQEKFGKKLGDIMQPVRVAVTGTNVSPGIYDVLSLVGRARSCQRIRDAMEMIKLHQKEVCN